MVLQKLDQVHAYNISNGVFPSSKTVRKKSNRKIIYILLDRSLAHIRVFFFVTMQAMANGNNKESNVDVTTETLGHMVGNLPQVLFEPEASYNPFEFWNLDEETLEDYSESVERGVTTAIERHHKGFNTATVSFTIILESIKDAQHRLETLTTNLSQCKRLIGESLINANDKKVAKEGDLSQSKVEQIRRLWIEGKQYKQRLTESEKVEHYLQVPKILAIYIRNRQFVHAAVLISDALHLYVTDLFHIDLLKHHQQILLEKKNALEIVLLEEFISYVYLKDRHLRDKIFNRKRVTTQLHDSFGYLHAMQKNRMNKTNVDEKDANVIDAWNKLLEYSDDALDKWDNVTNMNIGNEQTQLVNEHLQEDLAKRESNVIDAAFTGSEEYRYALNLSKVIVPTYHTLKVNAIDDTQYSRKLRAVLSAETRDSFLKYVSLKKKKINEKTLFALRK
ncbi:exocyst complex subunit 4 [Reticulomyxa filosa]|uniref:Exocyst complex component Sec8 n=1 Tax=Reticulomyxa filosa TaxID=46433 RepID=X6M7K6_RETFI|nr:exocyst complex subunit 4 [Reticulomyxa filosa]|eukprot:ETO09427.1 exocyst complex subunit 4 [Reticulomyxa filosa]